MIQIKERPESQSGDGETETRNYVVTGTNDKEMARALTYSYAPPFVTTLQGLLYRQNVTADQGKGSIVYTTATYGKRNTEAGQFTFSFTGTGGTVHITRSLASVARYPGTAKDHKQLIAVNGDNVDGADIVIPKGEFTISFQHPQGVVNLDRMILINSYAGYYNSAEMFGRPAGEILFMGANGSDGTDAEARVDYTFGYEQNLSGVTVGDITGIAKKGWDLEWTQWGKDDADGLPGQKPIGVYIERVYRTADLRTILGFG